MKHKITLNDIVECRGHFVRCNNVAPNSLTLGANQLVDLFIDRNAMNMINTPNIHSADILILGMLITKGPKSDLLVFKYQSEDDSRELTREEYTRLDGSWHLSKKEGSYCELAIIK